MLSKKSGNLFRIVLRWCNICGGMPFIWNGRRGRVSITKRGKIRWTIAFLAQVCLCIHTYFHISRFLLENVSNDDLSRKTESNKFIALKLHQKLVYNNKVELTDVDITYWITYTLVLTVILTVSINTIANLKELVCFTNTYLRFTAHFRGELCNPGIYALTKYL